MPIGRSQGCPFSRSFGIADDSLSKGRPCGFLRLRIFRLRLVIFQVAPVSHLPVCRRLNLRVTPNLLPLARRRANFKVALNLRSLGGAVAASSGCPDSTSTAGSMMNPQLSSNFASSAYAADESSYPTGPAFPSALQALSIVSARRQRTDFELPTQSILHFQSGRNCCPTSYGGIN